MKHNRERMGWPQGLHAPRGAPGACRSGVQSWGTAADPLGRAGAEHKASALSSGQHAEQSQNVRG